MHVHFLKIGCQMFIEELKTQIICFLCFQHNGLLQAKLVPDKATHTDTHIRPGERSIPPQEEMGEWDKGGRGGS